MLNLVDIRTSLWRPERFWTHVGHDGGSDGARDIDSLSFFLPEEVDHLDDILDDNLDGNLDVLGHSFSSTSEHTGNPCVLFPSQLARLTLWDGGNVSLTDSLKFSQFGRTS